MCAMVFVPFLAIGKLRNGGVLLTPFRHGKCRSTLFAQFTKMRSIHRGFYKRKIMDDDQKKIFCSWQLILNIFSVLLPILVGCKTKGAVGAACALLRHGSKVPNCQLLYEIMTTYRWMSTYLVGQIFRGFSIFIFFSVLRIWDVYPGSRILIFTHPGSRIPDPGSRIPDSGSKNSNKREGWEKICCHNFLCSHKFKKIANYFSFEGLKKRIWANFQRIIDLFTQKIVNKLSKIWVWDPGSGKKPIPDPGSRIPDPGSRGQKGTGSRIPDPGSRIRIRNTTLFKKSRSKVKFF